MFVHFIDERFWLAVCFAIFLLLVYKPIKSILFKFLDEYKKNIINKLDESKIILQESEKLLHDCKQKISNLTNETQGILDNAHRQASYIEDNAEKEFNEIYNKKLQNLKNILNYKRINSLKSQYAKMVDKTLLIVTNTIKLTSTTESNNILANNYLAQLSSFVKDKSSQIKI